MSASLQLSMHEPGRTPDVLARLRALLVAEAATVAARRSEHEALVDQLRGLLDADSVIERELAETGADRAAETLADIEHALHRLEIGAYGSCEACGLPMPRARLEAIPSARLCVACTGRRAGWARWF
ncbi:MAG: TraR/DksA family transcriptional regulator [Actinomycetota bacterium]|nr:TraR/DksA family transcriptional regulator [Actinomycetota bacterium]